jgi:hypothetical protein
MATSETTSVDRVFGALNEGSSVLLGAVRSANERAFRVTKALLEEAEQGRQAGLELGKKIVQDPTNLVGISNVAFDKVSEAQGRAIEMGRKSVQEIAIVAGEARDNAGEIAKAGREAAGGVAQAVREVYGRTSGAARAAVEAGLSTPVVEKVRSAARRVTAQDEAA